MLMMLHAENVCRPQVLSTGAVVVDLPGVRDANAARGAVAEKYMKSCNAVWIVADITRAVDNRTAKVWSRSAVHNVCNCPWAARYNTWLLVKLTPNGVVFSLLCNCPGMPSSACISSYALYLLLKTQLMLH